MVQQPLPTKSTPMDNLWVLCDRNDLGLIEANPCAVQVLGGAIRGRSLLDLIDSRDRTTANEALGRLSSGDATRSFLARIAGDEIPASWRLLSDGDRLIASARAPSESADRLRLHDRLVSLSLDMMCVAGFDAYFRWINPAFQEVLGHPTDVLLSRRFLDFVHPDDVAATVAELEHLEAGGRTIDFENRYRHADGSWRWLAWRAQPDVSERLVYAVARDITARREMERMKDAFVSMVSHELRTPLTSIHGALGLLAGGSFGEMPDAAGRLLDVARRNSERLVQLVNDILDVEKSRHDKPLCDRRPVGLGAVIDGALSMHEVLALEYGVRFELSNRLGATRVSADPMRIEQVVSNLLSNACRFSPPGATVRVQAERTGGIARVSVHDRGPGIPEDQRQAIFEPFSQGTAASGASHAGTGLGLAIARALIDEHGGQLLVDSTPGEGSTFWFELPCLPDDDPAV